MGRQPGAFICRTVHMMGLVVWGRDGVRHVWTPVGPIHSGTIGFRHVDYGASLLWGPNSWKAKVFLILWDLGWASLLWVHYGAPCIKHRVLGIILTSHDLKCLWLNGSV